jgi:hypothetical protein
MPAATPPPELPEPTELHARLSAGRELDWGDPLPTWAQIGTAYGPDATAQSATFLARAAKVEPAVTADVLDAIGSEGFSYRLENRLKSPQSLARKISTQTDYRRDTRRQQPEDVLRYTVGTDHPHQLVETAIRTVDRLLAKGWTTQAARQSYVDQSRYKGLHVVLRTTGQIVELQVHSRESLKVKEATTQLYAVQRDRTQSPAARARAGRDAVAISAAMTQPDGLADLKTLGGVPVVPRRYGDRNAANSRDPVETDRPTVRDNQHREQHRQQDRQDGMSR